MSDDERLERYAQALYERANPDDVPWSSVDEMYRTEYYEDANIAVTVSDEEQKNLRSAFAREINRLRAELADTKRRAVNDILSKNVEINRLRAELADTKRLCRHVGEFAEQAGKR